MRSRVLKGVLGTLLVGAGGAGRSAGVNARLASEARVRVPRCVQRLGHNGLAVHVLDSLTHWDASELAMAESTRPQQGSIASIGVCRYVGMASRIIKGTTEPLVPTTLVLVTRRSTCYGGELPSRHMGHTTSVCRVAVALLELILHCC